MPREIPAGLRVKYRHTREYEPIERATILKPFPQISPRGGATCAIIVDAEGREVAHGHAICHPSDNFNKSLERTIALGRALRELEIARRGY